MKKTGWYGDRFRDRIIRKRIEMKYEIWRKNNKSGLLKKYFDPKNQALMYKEIKEENIPELNFGISVAGWPSNF